MLSLAPGYLADLVQEYLQIYLADLAPGIHLVLQVPLLPVVWSPPKVLLKWSQLPDPPPSVK